MRWGANKGNGTLDLGGHLPPRSWIMHEPPHALMMHVQPGGPPRHSPCSWRVCWRPHPPRHSPCSWKMCWKSPPISRTYAVARSHRTPPVQYLQADGRGEGGITHQGLGVWGARGGGHYTSRVGGPGGSTCR